MDPQTWRFTANPFGKPNTAKTWHDVNPALPATNIRVLGPPPTSGTRDSFADLILTKGCETDPAMKELKKTDEKKGKFTLNVTSDDKTIEKKDRNVSEPIQFYSGRDHLLYELVVWTVNKKQATGYLSTPKNAPVPITTSQTSQ